MDKMATLLVLLVAPRAASHAQPAAVALVAADPAASAEEYGQPAALEQTCLTSGIAVAGVGRRQYCIDVAPADGQKLVVTVQTAPQALQAVTIGKTTYLRQPANASQSATTAIGAIIEVKPFQMSCERCDLCACIGCGHRCECSCHALGRLRRESSSVHTAGVLTAGRWYVGVDAPSAYTLRATLEGALALRSGEVLRPRTLYGTHATHSLRLAGASEGAAFADYYFADPRAHESLSLRVELLSSSSRAAYLDVFVRFGEWPTTELYDATMRVDRIATPHASFELRADRLINERLTVLVVCAGDAWVQYSIGTHTEPSSRVLGALGVVGGVALLALAALCRVRSAQRWSDGTKGGGAGA